MLHFPTQALNKSSLHRTLYLQINGNKPCSEQFFFTGLVINQAKGIII